jgi:hypothetical protein
MKKPTSSNVITSSWMKFVFSCISHMEGATTLPITYFLHVPPTYWLQSCHGNTITCVIKLPHLW